MAKKICETCGAEFEAKNNARNCPDCRAIFGKVKNKKSGLDKKLDDLHTAGTTYAEAQKAETLANIPPIEVPEHLMKAETPEQALNGYDGVELHEDYGKSELEQILSQKKAEAEATEKVWRFARACYRYLPDEEIEPLFGCSLAQMFFCCGSYDAAIERATELRDRLTTIIEEALTDL